MPDWAFRIGLWLLLATAGAANAQAAQTRGPLVIDAGQSQLALSPYVDYLHDVDGDADLDAARVWQQEGRFQPLPSASAAFGFQPGAFWFHARLVNLHPGEPRWLLVQEYALSDRVDVYMLREDGTVQHQRGGDHAPFKVRSIRYRHPNFALDLPPGDAVDLYVRVQSQSSMQVPLSLYTPTAFTEMSRDAQLAIGLYYGILLALFFYNLLLWLTLRDPSYFWYLFHITAFGLVLFTLNGLGFEYLWPSSAWLADKAVPLSICLALIGMQQFARTFLELPQRWPRGNWVSLGLITFFALLGLASLELPYRVSTPIASRAVLVGVLWIAVASIVVLRRGYRPARLFLLAWAMFLLGTTMFTLVAFGVLPKTFYTEYGVQIGSALEMLLLSVALGYRYAALRNENERIVREAKLHLEQKVMQRTGELRSALGQLENAHARLRESSERDGLTGLHNRTHFRERLLEILERGDRPVSLLMIDLDHFKSINDRHGHLVGDDCLRWAARTIGQTLRPHEALLARFGGEEFVAALPGMGVHDAARVGESLRQALHAHPCTSGPHTVRISASIGVHQLPTGHGDDGDDAIDQALQRADEALYAAKAGGRDCVRMAGALA